MASSMPITFVFAIALSFAADAIAIPRAAVRRPFLAGALHTASVLFVACVILALTRRPHFAAFLALALVALAGAVSNAKFTSLREPFVFTDLSLFSQLFSHPRLYLPFLSATTVVAMVLGSVALAAGFFLDPAVSAQTAWQAAMAALICFATGGLCAARFTAHTRSARRSAPSRVLCGLCCIFIERHATSHVSLGSGIDLRGPVC